ncbi:1-deoxy-D-xylulose-5-phosphate reductoisomerase [Helicobacter sp. 11S02596-1]|uniref:1-deoxy-D-xylulose-5-phosphate reductoisomerase n=1 Tax=Helicobacter sp. 11S02596-1 TaxID=1476194 RepID=UPI000BA5018C|nr:1-deoxy-D-xylulose-5-phosphate reductoisomerase [Helicobacter sp. 11S02596-1]PAF41393.1 1-deoxy-D-xylulose-5-phosphate reductoisomerase [Helicobacter sp. 11S02596-1]
MILLGSTGTIGVNALEIAQRFDICLESMSAGRNIDLFNAQIARHSPKKVAIIEPKDLKKLQPKGAKVYVGADGILEMIEESASSLVLNALVGFAGLAPTLQSLKCDKTLALANKESLVSAGWLIDTSKIIPIDSEHFGLWYLKNNRPIKKLLITASGGAFRDAPPQDIPYKSAHEALQHPNWKMGKKITIDSASMVNKLFEVLEAKWLFKTDNIDGYIERTSSIHALIEFVDGSTTAHFASPDMKLPIAYAINAKKALQTPIIANMELEKIQTIRFEPIDTKKFPLWQLKDTLIKNPYLGVILNASNEIAVKKFLDAKIPFGYIVAIVEKSLEKFEFELKDLQTQEGIIALDNEVRTFADSVLL